MFDFVYAHLLGILLGIVSGCIPGVGNFVLMLLVFPFLSSFDVTQLLVFYATMASISQYIGSIPATLYGIPGESSSYPVVSESKRLKSTTQVSNAISGSAIGSFFGSIIVVGIVWYFSSYAEAVKYFFSTHLVVALLLMVLVVMLFTVENAWYVNLLLILTGFALGLPGQNAFTNTSILTFDNIYMYAGLPLEIIVICLFAVPQILSHWHMHNKNVSSKIYTTAKIYFLHPISTAWSTVIGFFGGLIPGLTTVVSSMAAYQISCWRTKDPVKRIVASETANNAGAFSQLLPLLLFGVPIIGSEAILLFLMEQKGYSVSSSFFTELIEVISYNLLIANCIGLLLAWPLSQHVNVFYKINLKVMFTVILFLLFVITLYTGYTKYSTLFYLACFLVLAPIGALIKNINTLPLVFAFAIHDKLFEGLFRLTQLLS